MFWGFLIWTASSDIMHFLLATKKICPEAGEQVWWIKKGIWCRWFCQRNASVHVRWPYVSAGLRRIPREKPCRRQISGALAGFQDYNMITAGSQGWNMSGAEMWSSWAALKTKKKTKKNKKSAKIWQMWKNPFRLPSIFLLDYILVMNRSTRARIMWQYLTENLGWKRQCGSAWCSVPLRYAHITSTLQ